jgi:hypothetical protein
LQFWQWVDDRHREQGGENSGEYMQSLRQQAVGLLEEAWFPHTSSFSTLAPAQSSSGTSSEDGGCAMALLKLPPSVRSSSVIRHNSGTADGCALAAADSTTAKAVQDWLHYDQQIEVPVKCVGDELYVRISAHVHNELADYEQLAAAVCSLSTRK